MLDRWVFSMRLLKISLALMVFFDFAPDEIVKKSGTLRSFAGLPIILEKDIPAAFQQ